MQISFGKLLVFVPDIEVGNEFYGELLGLERVDGGEDFGIFRGADFELLLFRCAESTSADDYSKRAGSTVCFAVPDLLKSMRYLREQGVELLHSEPQSGPGLKYAAFADPFGTVHEIVEYAS